MTLKSAWNSIFKKKSLTTIQSWGLGGTIGFPGSKKEYIDKGFNGLSVVSSVVTIISETFATCPKVLYKVKPGSAARKAAEKYKLLTKQYNSSLIDKMRLKEQAFEEIESHPLLDLLEKPNDLQGGFDFMVHVNASRDITGDTFIWVNQGITGGKPLALVVLPSHYMNLKAIHPFTRVDGFQLNIGKQSEFTTDEVLHWRHMNLDYDVTGQHLFGRSPLKPLCEDYTLTANKEGKKSAAKGFKNQGAGGLLSRNEDIVWTKEQRDGLNEYLDDVVNGNDNKMKVRAANAKMEWIQLAMSSADQKIWEGISATKEDICNAYNFPIHILSTSSATDNNYSTSNKYLVTKTVYSRWISFRDFVNSKLLPMYEDGADYYFDFDISSFPEVQDDQKKLVESLEKMPITLNEMRSVLGWDTIVDENMDKVYIASNKIPLDQANMDVGQPMDQTVTDLNNKDANDYK